MAAQTAWQGGLGAALWPLLSASELGASYQRLFASVEPGARGRKYVLNKKRLKKKQKPKGKSKQKAKVESSENGVPLPEIVLHSNPSAFNVYAHVRQCVLERRRHLGPQGTGSKLCGQSALDSESDEEEEEMQEPPAKLPKIVSMGLCGVFELIRETCASQPALCARSLHALLNMLQGLLPEELQSEPSDVLASLFTLLLDLATRSGHTGEPLSEQPSSGHSLGSLACACLFSLVVAWGDTGKILKAISAILTHNGSLCSQHIMVPAILVSLQRSVQAALVGRAQIQDWFGAGVQRRALFQRWQLREVIVEADCPCLLQSDGTHLYFLTRRGLYRVGSGYGGTVRGHVYHCNLSIHSCRDRKSWLGFAQGKLLYQEGDTGGSASIATCIDPETLEQNGTIVLPGPIVDGDGMIFADGESVNQIAACKDEGFVVRTFCAAPQPVLLQELQLKLARKCLHACGLSLLDMEKDLHIISTGFDEELAVLGAGREFALMRTITGKVYYTGKYQSLGIKQGGPAVGKWVELTITKSPKVVQFAVGHDGGHVLLVAEDGSVFFAGTARKGEDGESAAKSRRQPKACKPKKMIRMEGKVVVQAACNTGSSALITREGELFVFGKDAVYSDGTGLVKDFRGQTVTHVALGKAHACVLTKSGSVWTFGVNNKGQCGRDTGGHNQAAKGLGSSEPLAVAAMEEDLEEDVDEEKDERGIMCAPGTHSWKLEQCMVCAVCGECTGYGANCVSSGRPDRAPGLLCGCGSGDAGCGECGCCKACARELDGPEVRQRGLLDAVKEVIPLDIIGLMCSDVDIEEEERCRTEDKSQRINRKQRLDENKGMLGSLPEGSL